MGLLDSVIILPTYNEADNLRVLLPKLKRYDVDILVVDDSPSDLTAEVARAHGCQVIRREGKRGRISALLEGIESTSHARIITMDADMQHPPEVIPTILQALDRSDVVIGSRNVPGGGYDGFPKHRMMVSSIAKLLAYPLVPKLKDRSSGLVAFRRDVLDGHVMPEGFSTLVLSVMVMGQYDTFEEVPYYFKPRAAGESKLSMGLIADHLRQLAKLYLHKFRLLRYMMVGGSGMLLGLLILYLLTDLLGLHYLASYAIAFLASVTNNYVWNCLWTFNDSKGAAGWFKYAVIYSFTLLINVGLMYLLTDLLGLWYLASAVVVVLIVFILNYFISRRVVWGLR